VHWATAAGSLSATKQKKLRTQRNHHAVGKRQRPGLEELGLANSDLSRSHVNVTQIEPRELAQPQSGAVREHDHRVQGERAQR